MCSKRRLPETRGPSPRFPHSLAFRLTLWYAVIFTVTFAGAYLGFYLFVLQAGHGLSHHALGELREAARHYFVLPLIVVVALSAGVGWFMAKRALRGVEDVTSAAEAISQGALDRRVAVKGRGDEVDRLAETFNTMVDRIQALLGQMREITENIAHDLRSPITRMRGAAELIVLGTPEGENRTEMAGTIIEECDRLLGMINTTLDISEAEAGLSEVRLRESDVAAMARDVAELFQPSAEDKRIALTVETPGRLIISCDVRKAQRILANLIDNGIKYTQNGGQVAVSVTENGAGALLRVRDTGIGIPEEDKAHVFDRFYRGEKSRSTAGNGLGLSLARAFVLIHGGTIEVASEVGRGSCFSVFLPKGGSESANRA